MYRVRLPEGVIREDTGETILPGKPGWRKYQQWLAAGGVPLPPVVEKELLSVRQDRAWSAIKEKREQVKHGGVLVAGKWFHSDEASRVQQLGLVMMGASVPAVPWKTMDGSFVTMSQGLAGQIFQAVVNLDMAAFAAAETHKAGMLGADDPAAYDYTAGWPVTYGG